MAGFSTARRSGLATLIHRASPEFYDLIPHPHPRVLTLIASLLGVAGTEFHTVHLLDLEGEDIGLVTELPALDLATVNQSFAVAALRSLAPDERGGYLRALQAHQHAVEPLAPEGLYAGRLAAAPSADGLGVGRVGVRYLIGLAGDGPLQFHVKADNGLAISAYRKLGCRFVSDAAFTYRSMVHTPEPGGGFAAAQR